MYLTGCLGRLRADPDRPRSGLILTGCQKALESKNLIAGLNELFKTGFLESQILQKHCLFLIIQLGNLLLDLGTDHKHLTTCFLSEVSHCLHTGIASTVIGKIILCHIGCKNNRLIGQQIIGVQKCKLVLILCHKASCKLSLLKMCLQCLQQCCLLGKRFIHSGCLACLGNSSFQNLNIGKDQFQINGFNITHGIDASIHVYHIGILKATHHMYHSIHFPDVAQELVSKTFPLGSALHQTGNIHEFNHGGRNLLRVIHISQKL